MEIMGIAVVVIIVSIVILFVVRWGILKGPVEHKKEFAQSEIATNLVNTMLSTTTGCKGLNFNELFQDCFEGFSAGGRTACAGDWEPDSCSYVLAEVQTILTNTLGEWNYKYEFTVGSETASIITIDECVDAEGNTIIERKARTYPLPGGLEAKLAICG